VPVLTESQKDNQSYYDDFAAGYERGRHHGYHRLVDDLEAQAVLRYGRGARVLEAGCGTGLILSRVAPLAKLAVGVDLSRGMLGQARARGLKVVHGSVTDIPFADASFDVCYSFKVLAHVEAIERALAEMARVVRPGGHVLAEFYNPWSLRYLVKRWKRPTQISADTHDEVVFTRYDTLGEIRRYLPRSLDIVDLHGVRVVTPISRVHDLPLVGAAWSGLERRLASAPGFRRLGGFLIVVATKK